jgi:TolB protein
VARRERGGYFPAGPAAGRRGIADTAGKPESAAHFHPFSYMHVSFLRVLILAAGTAWAGVAAAQPVRKIGEVVVTGDQAIGVKITANARDLQDVVDRAFESHGRYKRVAGGQIFEMNFTAVSANQVKVDVTRGAARTNVMSQTFAGTTARQAALRAADAAVEATNGLGLRGYFTARLAFILQQNGNRGDVYTADLFMGEAKRLTQDNALTLTPRWAPDGTRLIYTSYFRSGAPDIFLLDANTGRKETFVSFRGTNTGARFSPTGQQVAMVLSGEGTPEIYVSNAQGRQVARRTRSDAVKSSPAWSPDGARIVFAMDPGPQLYVMPAAGGSPQRLSSGYSYTAEPDWSRTSPGKIACTVREGGRYQIAVYDFSKGRAEVKSKAPFDGVEPSWLPDGRHLVYTARDRSTSVLCILDTETGKSTRISPSNSSAVGGSVWAPAR